MALLYCTKLSTCSTIAEAFDSTSHDRITRMLPGPLGRNLDRLSFEDRQAVVQLLVEKVVVHPDGAVDVHHVLPFEEQPVVADQKKKRPRLNLMWSAPTAPGDGRDDLLCRQTCVARPQASVVGAFSWVHL
jgi:hypothetical protein